MTDFRRRRQEGEQGSPLLRYYYTSQVFTYMKRSKHEKWSKNDQNKQIGMVTFIPVDDRGSDDNDLCVKLVF